MRYGSETDAKTDFTDRACRDDCALYNLKRKECFILTVAKSVTFKNILKGSLSIDNFDKYECSLYNKKCLQVELCDCTSCSMYDSRQYAKNVREKEGFIYQAEIKAQENGGKA